MKELRPYTPYQAEVATKLQHNALEYKALHNVFADPLLKDKPTKVIKVLMPTDDGKMARLELDRQFVFGSWLCMRTLIKDLANDGCYDEAVDIVTDTFKK